ncbi:probable pseudouridine-5'-phosphatase isoform X1 [Agrilus planipennis]|uniref:pseudouridine 5'-phosphatase n=1 Tax=Agrilus planipennis TaxID=224129 RepID=A0A1W4WK88_AGRPL|nr:probable pseudouridine-5'-phosphatase isoform X1 [Agrilus planipennis]
MNRFYSNAVNGFKKVSHVIFDVDGLLIDTENLYTQAIQNILDNYGKTFTWELKVQTMGLVGKDAAKKMIDLFDLPISHEEYYKQLTEQYQIMFQNCELMPGAERIVRHFHSSNVPIAVATSSNEDAFRIKMQNHQELFSLFNHIVCGGTDPHVKAGKPHPDIFLVCASRFPEKPSPEQCLVFEDSHNGVLAAKSANMQCVMVPDERLTDEYRKDATVVLSTLHDFKPELFGLPPLN